MVKFEVKEKRIVYAKNKTKNVRTEINDLEERLQFLNNNKIHKDEQKYIKQKLETLYTNKAKGAQIRSRIKFLEDGEKNTRYFMSLEKSRQTRKTLTKFK